MKKNSEMHAENRSTSSRHRPVGVSKPVIAALGMILIHAVPLRGSENPGDYVVSNHAMPGNDNSHGLALGDLDGDGDLDAWVANGYNPVQPDQVWLNDGAGVFSVSGQRLGNSFSENVALGDVDGDGDLDACVATFGYFGQDSANRVWFNDGSGHFSNTGRTLGYSGTEAIALGDIDGDGDLDGFVATGNANEIWMNNGSGTFTNSGQRLGSSPTVHALLADLDQDGDLDAWVTNRDGQPNRVWINDGSGSFTDSGLGIGNSNSGRMALGDVDGDGDLDAWVANRSSQPNKLWINDGAGVFSDSGQAMGNSNSNSVALADVDADGDLDAWVANRSGQPNRLWLNDGSGNFSDSGQAMGGFTSHDVALGDLDQDGDLDAWVTNWGQNKTWMNSGQSGIIEIALEGDWVSVKFVGELETSDDLVTFEPIPEAMSPYRTPLVNKSRQFFRTRAR